jgi:hypothetical protein
VAVPDITETSERETMGDQARTWTAPIASRTHWVRTGIQLRRGLDYRFEATGRWTDLIYRCDADGYQSKNWVLGLFERARRVPAAPWFALIGALDSDRANRFVIGTQTTYQPVGDGELLCFANDLWLMYFNNHGTIELQVTEVAD